jgi:hypothetical protein
MKYLIPLLVLLLTTPAWAANEVLLKTGTVICLADTTDYAPAAGNNLCTRTDQIDLTSVGNNAYRQSAKVDFGATRAARYHAQAALEFAVAPTDGNAVNLYLAPSASATAANANPGGVSGSDAAYTGYSSNAASSVRQLQFIGACVLTVQATTTIQIAECGVFTPPERYGSLVFHNNSGQAMVADAVEMAIRIAPIVDEIQ